jgi:hypothetical protein
MLLFIFFTAALGGLRATVAMVLAVVVLFIIGLAFKRMFDVDIYSKRGG